MSEALKCDRCKECFDPYAVEENSYFITITEFYAQNGEQKKNRETGYRDEYIHLCPSCARIFGAFIQGEPLVPATMLEEIQANYADLLAEKEKLENEQIEKIRKEMAEELEMVPAESFKNLFIGAIDRAIHGVPDSGNRKVGKPGDDVADGQSKAPERKKRAKKNGK